MVKQKIEDAFNKQINAELYSSYLYLSMSAYCEEKNFSGFAHWLRLQADEEYSHAMKFFNFLHQVGGSVKLTALKAPKADWTNFTGVFKDVYEHEKQITGMINQLVELAAAEKDFAAGSFLQWFVNEQVEEEATALKILERLKMIGDNKNGLLWLDSDLSKRQA